MSGIDLIEKLHEKYPDLLSAILSGHLSSEYVRRALTQVRAAIWSRNNPTGILEAFSGLERGIVH